MTDKKEKPLPRPPHTAFGRKKPAEQREEEGPLLADRLAAAMAEGKVEDFLKKELPDNEYARSLTSMMMGMTGMMPMGGEAILQPSGKTEKTATHEPAVPSGEVPEDVKAAVRGGDVKGLTDLLRREHRKRTPEAETTTPMEEPAAAQTSSQSTIDKELIDALIRIAGENGVTLDWMILRAIRLYVRDYKKSGRL